MAYRSTTTLASRSSTIRDLTMKIDPKTDTIFLDSGRVIDSEGCGVRIIGESVHFCNYTFAVEDHLMAPLTSDEIVDIASHEIARWTEVRNRALGVADAPR
jgi:hypothetical protein